MRLGVDALNLRADERGMGRYVRRIVRELTARPEWQVTLLVRDPAAAGAYRSIAGERAAVAPVAAARERDAFDAVWYPWNAWRFATSGPSLVTINDDFAFRFPARGLVARAREQQPIRRAVRCATRIATISQWSRDALAERFGLDPQRIGILPLAPDPWFVPDAEPSPFAEPFVLFVGGGERRKNLTCLLAAFGLAFPGRAVRLVVAGDVDAAASYPLTVIRRADDTQLRTLYRTARAVAVPSLAEGFGLVVTEAQACGTAVIAADAGAVREAGGEAALFVDPLHVADWAAGLATIVGDDAENARLRAASSARWATAPRDGATGALVSLLEELTQA
jgi:glycosyltransferase involved in cell wall biosynthesis